MDIEEWAIPSAVAIVAIAGFGFAVLARIGSIWRNASEEWSPDEVGTLDEG